jgi:uncharacterized coiled-coil protein SlyX
MADESVRCEPIEVVDDIEKERRKRRAFINHLRDREKNKPRFVPNEDGLREKRMHERDTAKREQSESEAAATWLIQEQCAADLKRAEPVRRTGVAASIAAEPELVEDFNWEWVSKFVAWRLAEERKYFEARLDELDKALVDQGQTCNEVMNAVVEALERTLNTATQKSNDHLVGALQKITETMAANQHAIIRAINNRIGEHGKPIDEPPQSARRGVH